MQSTLTTEATSGSEFLNITFGEFAQQLIAHEQLYKAHNTLASARQAVLKFEHLNNIPLSSVKHIDIQFCVDRLINEGLKTSSVKTYLRSINYIFRQAVDPYGIIPVIPIRKIKIPPVAQSDKEFAQRALEEFEVVTLLRTLKSKDISLKYYYLCSVALGTGLRAGEIFSLTWSDIDFSKKEISISKQWKNLSSGGKGFGTLKSSRSERTIPVSAKTLSLLSEYRECFKIVDISNRVFSFRPESLGAHLLAVSRKMGFRVTMHTLRHTYATNLIANGIDFKTAADILGPEVEMTMKVYSHVTNDMRRIASQKIQENF